MAKSKVTDWSQTASLNTDIGGVGINGNDSAKNIRPAFQQMMKQIADVNHGVPLDDTFALRNAADNTKGVTITAANVPPGQTYELDAAALYRQGAPTETYYTASGTHTFAAKTTFFQIEGCGGGGGGGGVDGQSVGTIGIAGGGSSGFYGVSGILTKGSILTGAVVIGTGGAGGAGLAGANGINGGDTTWVDAVNSFTFGKGLGGKGAVASSDGVIANGAASGSAVGALQGISREGEAGNLRGVTSGGVVPQIMKGGKGGNTKLGEGGSQVSVATATPAAGGDASGYGAGGGGASVAGLATNFAGGAGAPGILIVREW
jgi:hypothetical protein